MSKPKDNIQVVVRIRPSNEEERRDKYTTVTQAINDRMLVFDPKLQRSIGFLQTKRKDVSRRRFKDLKYAFDYVFGPTTKNQDVFHQSMKCIVQGVVEGYNCSVFAYGATGAGKTHTMLGNDVEPGVIYHTMIDLYQKINEHTNEKSYDVSVSYSEVYNEQVRDLLIPRGNLPIREDKTVGVIITGLSLHKPKTADELLRMLQFGNKNRTQHPTDANAESSRSHAVFQVFVSQKHKAARFNSEVKMAKMCLVDLAGSERAHATTNHGLRFREGANINRSLLALGNVINALADSKFKGHIPYRESKLTRLLKDSLGGNCRTVMIAAVSPSSKSYDDTYNTLRYADRAKHIRANLKQNVMSVDLHIANYKKYVEELEREAQELRKENICLEKRLEQRVGQSAFTPGVKDLENKLLKLFKTRREIRKSQMASDGVIRELKWKLARKEKTINRVQTLTQSLHVMGKHSRVIDRMKQRIEKEEYVFESASKRLKHQEGLIQSTYVDAITSLISTGFPIEALEQILRLHTIDASLQDTTTCLAFVKKMALAQERQANVNEKLIVTLLDMVKRQADIINSEAPNLLVGIIKKKYEECCYLVEERGPNRIQEVAARIESGQGDINEIIDIKVPRIQVASCKADLQKYCPKPNTNSVKKDDNLTIGNANSSDSSNAISKKQSSTSLRSVSYNVIKSTIKHTNKASAKPTIKPTNAVKPSARSLNVRRTSRHIPETLDNIPLMTLEQINHTLTNIPTERPPLREVNQTSTAQVPQITSSHLLITPQTARVGDVMGHPGRSKSLTNVTLTMVMPVVEENNSRPDMTASSSDSTEEANNSDRLNTQRLEKQVKISERKGSRTLVLNSDESIEEVQDYGSCSDNNTFQIASPSQQNTPNVGNVKRIFINQRKQLINVPELHPPKSVARRSFIDNNERNTSSDNRKRIITSFTRTPQLLKNNAYINAPSTSSQSIHSSQKIESNIKARRLLIPPVFLNSSQKKSNLETLKNRKDVPIKMSSSTGMQLSRESGNNSTQSQPRRQPSPANKTQGHHLSDSPKTKTAASKTRKPLPRLKIKNTASNEPNDDMMSRLKPNGDVAVPQRIRPSPAPRARRGQTPRQQRPSTENKPAVQTPDSP